MQTDFLANVMKYFDYLVTEYGFHVVKVNISKRSPNTEGRIEFESPTTFVVVSSEQWTAGAIIGRIQDDRYRYFLNPLQIRKYYVLTETDKKLLASLDPKDDPRARLLHRAANLTRTKDSNESTEAYIFAQLSDYSKWLREYANPFLLGDFTLWPQIYEFSVINSRAAHIRSGKNEFARSISQNKEESISIFQNDFDYLERLKKEYGKV